MSWLSPALRLVLCALVATVIITHVAMQRSVRVQSKFQAILNYWRNASESRPNTNATTSGHAPWNITHDFLRDSDVFRVLADTKFQQYKRFQALYPDFVFRSRPMKTNRRKASLEQYQTKNKPSYNVSVHEESEYIVVLIEEHYSAGAEASRGGGGSSLFGVVSRPCNHSLCAYWDHFDGRYTMLCPRVTPRRMHLKVTVLQLDFQQFKGDLKSVDIVLLDRELVADGGAAGWSARSVAATTKWRCRALQTKRMCAQIGRLDRVYMVGASHMRYQFLYLLQTCAPYVPHIEQRLYLIHALFGLDVADFLSHVADTATQAATPSPCTAPTVTTNINDYKTFAKLSRVGIRQERGLRIFVFGNQSHTLHPGMINAVNYSIKMPFCSTDPNQKIGIIVQTGSWDLTYKGLKLSLAQTIPALDKSLSKLSKAYADKAHVQFLVMAQPPLNPRYFVVGRANDEIQLFVSALEKVVRRHGQRVGFFNTFNAVYPAYWDNVDSHYLRCIAGRKQDQCRGKHGMIILQDAINALAQQFQQPDTATNSVGIHSHQN